MACKYYRFKDNDFYCIKQKEYVDSDWYYDYCRDYSYDECDIYKEESSGGCYVTSACVEAMGLPDDCYELETLRRYRDTWLKNTDEGSDIIRMYYKIAPKIVEAIDKRADRECIYKMIYGNMVKPCVELIEHQKYQEALELYRKMTLELEKNYC